MAKDSLDEYGSKRSFAATPEPAPAIAANRAGPLLFVVQLHAATRLHYDLRLELDGVLKSWAVPRGLSLDRSEKRLAMQTEDHPYEYASFEGVIPAKQYGAGEMIVWDCGVYSPDEGGPTFFHDRERAEREVREGLAKGKLGFQLRGEKLKGSFALVKTKEANQWLIIKHRDRFVSEEDVLERAESVLSGATVENVLSAPLRRMPAARLVPTGKVVPMPKKVAPMLAEIGEKAFNKSDWMWEPKLDGYRVLAFIDEGGVDLRSRRGLDLGVNFPTLAEELGKLQSVNGMILDGEIIAFDASGKPTFNALQERAQLKTAREIEAADRSLPVVFYAFDLLYFGGVDLRDAPYEDRRRYLSQVLLPSPRVRLVHAEPDGVALQAAALASGFEGVVGKRRQSRYESGKRSTSWLKVKPTQSADFVVGGYMKSNSAPQALGSLLVGYWDKGKLHYASHVGSGFDDRMRAQVKKHLDALQRDKSPFAEKPPMNGTTVWVEPKSVAEVTFHSWTTDGALRSPVFVRMREDLDPKKIVRLDPGPLPAGAGGRDDIVEQLNNSKTALTLAIGKHRIKLSNLDRVYWPEDKSLKQRALTKRDLLRYFAQVGPYILPHLADRPLTMIRMPSGIGGQRFFQKHWEQEKPDFAETVTVFSDHKDESHEYLLCNNLETLLWLAQSGTLEFHVWHSRAKVDEDSSSKSTDYASSLESMEGSVLNFPDYVVFDIDPYIYSGKEKPGDEPELNTRAFEKGKEVAFALRELLHEMSLDAVVKTSGKTGLHIFVPIRRTLDFDAARHISEMVSRHLMQRRPKDITVEWSIPKRTGKIFMDYNMNVRGKTLNVAYSPRGVAGAPVSMPLTWDELARAHPLDFHLLNAAERLAQTGDRWADVIERKYDLEAALSRSKA